MARPRVFSDSETGSHAGVYHVVSRFVDRRKCFGDAEREVFRRMMEGFAAFHQVEILTYCLMGNHFHLLVRVPRRPAGFDMPLEAVMDLLGRAIGAERMKGLRSQFRIWEEAGAQEGIEAWRQRMLGRMFSLSEFMKALKQRFSQWYNRSRGRRGVLWEGRYKCVIVQDRSERKSAALSRHGPAVQDEERALRVMGTYIDLNPVRAGITDDPGKYRWCGYAEAMAGKAAAIDGIVKITGTTAERVHGSGLEGSGTRGSTSQPVETAAQRKRRELKALVHYRQLLGIAGRPRVREDGVAVRRGVSAKVQARLESESGVKREQLLRRVRHFTDGVILGSREFIDSWFERNRSWFGGRSAEKRRTGARSIGKDWKQLYNLRQLRG